MKRDIYKILACIFYLLSLFVLLFCMKVRITPNTYIKTFPRVLLNVVSCVFIYIGGYIYTKKVEDNKRILKMNLIIYFLIYTFTICTLTLFDEILGRQGLVIVKWDQKLVDLYFKYSFNIVPFKTIKLFTKGYINGIVSFKNFSVNILGNLCAFMPFAIFLPLIFKKMNSFLHFLVTMILIVLVIELLQFATMSGSCDIDDLILNVFGASVVYLITRIKFINNVIGKIFLLE